MSDRIFITLNGRVLPAQAGTLLSHLIDGEHPCAGRGRCGKCRVLATGALSPVSEAEKKHLSEEELRRGVRLSCLTRAMGDCTVTTEQAGEAQILTSGVLPALSLSPTFEQYGAAIDIGTTTLAAHLYGKDGRLLAQAAAKNPQATFGADVVSRIEAALNGQGQALTAAILQAIDALLYALAEAVGVPTNEIDGVVLTGNTAMLSFACGVDTEPLSHAPFAVKDLFGRGVTAADLPLTALKGCTPVYLAPCISAFVGADTVCAVLSAQLQQHETALLADIGTNGEMALWHKKALTVCSTAAGPAFEGVGISAGMQGTAGAIYKVTVEKGRLISQTIGDTAPRGICGSGLIDAVAAMLQTDVLDEGGYLEGERFALCDTVALTDGDIRMLQLAKSAICAGIITLLKQQDLTPSAKIPLYIAGGFGTNLNLESAAAIGLLPAPLTKSATAIGNAALTGAAMLLLSREMRDKAEQLAKEAILLSLATSSTFSEAYMMGMLLAPTEE